QEKERVALAACPKVTPFKPAQILCLARPWPVLFEQFPGARDVVQIQRLARQVHIGHIEVAAGRPVSLQRDDCVRLCSCRVNDGNDCQNGYDADNGGGYSQSANESPAIGCLLPLKFRVRHVVLDPLAAEHALIDSISDNQAPLSHAYDTGEPEMA